MYLTGGSGFEFTSTENAGGGFGYSSTELGGRGFEYASLDLAGRGLSTLVTNSWVGVLSTLVLKTRVGVFCTLNLNSRVITKALWPSVFQKLLAVIAVLTLCAINFSYFTQCKSCMENSKHLCFNKFPITESVQLLFISKA